MLLPSAYDHVMSSQLGLARMLHVNFAESPRDALVRRDSVQLMTGASGGRRKNNHIIA